MSLVEQFDLPLPRTRAKANCFPRAVSPKAPPIKSQGIKTKIVPFILGSFSWDASKGTWIEPFVGSGAVAFNTGAPEVLAADSNRHIIGFYQAIQSGIITPAGVRKFLTAEGAVLEKKGEDHYYAIRDRFNKNGDPVDFLFLSRACFNGMIRFNKRGGYNVPFCRKPERFRPAYVTKIVNQVAWISDVIRNADWKFVVQDWRKTLQAAKSRDFVYLDPPYIGRHTDYFNSWDEEEANALAGTLRALPSGFAYSMWYKNQYRENAHLARWFSDYPVVLTTHFYHVGPTESLRNPMEEALVISPKCAL
jgi:DNA adenine methylase